MQISTLILVYIYIRNKVIEKNNRQKIYLPPVVMPFAPPDAETARPKETNYLEHELEQVQTLTRSTLMGLAMTSFMHWKMGVKPVLLLQSIMGPMNLVDNGLVKKYLMGSTERVWGEWLDGEDGNERVPLREQPEGKEDKAGDEDDTSGVHGGASAVAATEAKAKLMEKVLDHVFNKEASCEVLIKMLTKENVNYMTKAEKYSPLTVLCSRPDVTEEQVKKALYLGAHKFHRDDDGCTALHWAAMKGVVAAAEVLTSGSNKDVEKLLGMEDGDKKTPLDLAKESVEPDHEEVEEILVGAQKRVETALVDLD